MGKHELDKFVVKFKQLWLSGQEVELHVKAHAGQAWVTLNAALGLGGHHPQPPQQQHRNGPARKRRRERRAAERKAVAELNTEEVAVVQVNAMGILNVAENAIEDITNAIHTSSENENQLVAENASTTKDTEIVDLENEIAKLKTINAKFEEKLESTEKEKEDLKQDLVVRVMLHDGLKHDMKERFGYDSEKEAEEYYQKLLKEDELKCEKCNFVGKTEAGLRTHVTLKQEVKCIKCKVRIENNESIEEHIC